MRIIFSHYSVKMHEFFYWKMKMKNLPFLEGAIFGSKEAHWKNPQPYISLLFRYRHVNTRKEHFKSPYFTVFINLRLYEIRGWTCFNQRICLSRHNRMTKCILFLCHETFYQLCQGCHNNFSVLTSLAYQPIAAARRDVKLKKVTKKVDGCHNSLPSLTWQPIMRGISMTEWDSKA